MTDRSCRLSDKECTNLPPHHNSGLLMTVSAATCRYKHENSLHTGVPLNRVSHCICFLGPHGRAASSRWVGNKVPSPAREKGDLRQHADAVFVIPALKPSQHLGCDLSLEGFRRGNERALWDLKISNIEIQVPRRKVELPQMSHLNLLAWRLLQPLGT